MDDSSTKAGGDTGENRARGGNARKPARRSTPATQGVGNALRSVYDEAREEAIPQEMLDLLGKLG